MAFLKQTRADTRTFVKLLAVFDSCKTLDHKKTFRSWIMDLYQRGILSDRDFLYLGSKVTGLGD